MQTGLHGPWTWDQALAALRATQGFTATVTLTAATTFYTVPAGKRFIVKNITAQHQSAGSVSTQVRLPVIGTIWNFVLGAYGGGSDRSSINVWWVLNPGDTIQMNNLTAGHATAVIVSGSLHTI